MKREIEIIEVPTEPHNLALRRMAPFVRHAAEVAALGNLDLNALAASAYLQGVADCGEAFLRIRDEAARINTGDSSWWAPLKGFYDSRIQRSVSFDDPRRVQSPHYPRPAEDPSEVR
jgi:hypothetical protein